MFGSPRLAVAWPPLSDATIDAACSGFIYSLSVADALIRAGRGKKALVLGSEILSSVTDYTDRGTCILLADAAGAVYVARWTTFHVRQLARSMKEVLSKEGFCFIEVISPCPTLYQRRNRLGDGLDTMKDYKARSKVRHGAPTGEVALGAKGDIIVGKFVDRERPDGLRQRGSIHPLDHVGWGWRRHRGVRRARVQPRNRTKPTHLWQSAAG